MFACVHAGLSILWRLGAYHWNDLDVREGAGPGRPHQRITYWLHMEDVAKLMQTAVEVVGPKLRT
jgi:hypothetical protein